MTTKRTYALIAWLGLMASFSATAETLVTAGDGTDSVFFRSSAKLEFIEGKSSDLVGLVNFDPDDPSTSTGGFKVDLRTLRTGIETRDEHMRENHLHTDEFPHAYFELTRLVGFKSNQPAGQAFGCQADGVFYIHGVKRSTTAELEVTPLQGENNSPSYYVEALFSVVLDDYQIDRPKLLFLKLAEKIELEIRMTLISGEQASPVRYPDYKLID